MKIKIIMNSGKEYTTEDFDSVEKLIDSTVSNIKRVIFSPLGKDRKVWINGNSISSVEVIE